MRAATNTVKHVKLDALSSTSAYISDITALDTVIVKASKCIMWTAPAGIIR